MEMRDMEGRDRPLRRVQTPFLRVGGDKEIVLKMWKDLELLKNEKEL